MNLAKSTLVVLKTKRARLAISAILLLTTVLYWIGASKNGYGNSFYAAAVQAGTHSWKAFFFGSLDASNFITVDKPPFSLWMMEISTRIFGFHSWSMMLPEVLAGVATVYLVYASVRRWFDSKSALIAAAVMALSPVAVLMFGFNNPDAILTLLLTASVYTTIRAFENKRPVFWLSMTGILTGCAFNTKMLQGLIVVPIIALVYLIFASPKFWTRFKHLLLAAVPLLIAALWWPMIVSITPANDRPYVGSSTNDSIWNLIVGYNGLGRLDGTSTGMGGGKHQMGKRAFAFNHRGTNGSNLPSFAANSNRIAGGGMPTGRGGGGFGGGIGGSGFGGSTGVLRMFNTSFGPNIGWLIPASAVAAITVFWQRRKKIRADKVRIAFMLWGGYLALHYIVFSKVSGVIHPYYPVVMTPAVAALIGMGAPILVRTYKRGGNQALALPFAVALTGVTASIILGYESSFMPWLRWSVLIFSLISALLLITHLLYPLKQQTIKLALILAALSCFSAPVVYSIDTATLVHTGSIPSAGPADTGMAGSNNESSSAESSLVSYLLKHQDGSKWIVAVNSANTSAAIQISTGQPVMAIGGFNGSDNAISLANFKKLVVEGKVRYYAISSGGMGIGGGGQGNSQILNWVKSSATKVNYGGSSYTLYKLN
jgi:4-amino-4-deoxy-L-arabinose transferase-like glycosyltransferase